MDKKRSPAIALLLSLALPGLGQLYTGRPGWALWFWLGALGTFAVFGIIFGALGASLGTAYYASLGWAFLLWLGAAIQAAWLAGRAEAEYRLRFYNLKRVYLLCWLLGAVLPAWGATRLGRSLWLTTFEVEQENLRPDLLAGDWVLVDLRRGSLEKLQPGAWVAWREKQEPQAVRFGRVEKIDGPELTLAGDRSGMSAPLVMRKGDLLGRALLVRASRDPQTGQWRPERRRLRLE